MHGAPNLAPSDAADERAPDSDRRANALTMSCAVSAHAFIYLVRRRMLTLKRDKIGSALNPNHIGIDRRLFDAVQWVMPPQTSPPPSADVTA